MPCERVLVGEAGTAYPFAPLAGRRWPAGRMRGLSRVAFHADGIGANMLRLSFSCAGAAAIEEGISRLGRLLASERLAA